MIIPKEFVSSIRTAYNFDCYGLEYQKYIKKYNYEYKNAPAVEFRSLICNDFYSKYPKKKTTLYVSYNIYEKYWKEFLELDIDFTFGLDLTPEIKIKIDEYDKNILSKFSTSEGGGFDWMRKAKVDLFYDIAPLTGNITSDDLLMIKLKS